MEGHDTFQQGIEIGEEDPFAGSDFGDWEQPSNDSPPVVPAAAPTVTATAPVSVTPPQSPAGAPTPAQPPPPEPQAAEAPSIPTPDGEQPAGAASGTPQASTAAPAAPPEAAPDAPAPAQQPPSAPAGTAAPPTAQIASQSVAQEDEDPGLPWDEEAARREEMGDVPIDTEGLPPVPADFEFDRGETRVLTQDDLDEAGYDGPIAQDGEVPVTHPAHPVNYESADAPVPDETKDKRGRVTHRRYVLLRADAKQGQFTQLDWFEDKNRNLVARNSAGAKRQTVVLARGTDDALKFGFAVVGSPQTGADLIAVAAAYFQVKKVEPEPPEPMKQRLRIS